MYGIDTCAQILEQAMEKQGYNHRVARKKIFLEARKIGEWKTGSGLPIWTDGFW